MRNKMVLAVLVMCLCASLAFAVGNKNDLAYLSLNELEDAGTPLSTDEILIGRSDVPMQGVLVSEIQQVDMVGGGTTSITGYTVGVDYHNTTDNTIITAAESGTTYICSQNTKFQLPAAADGLIYTFVTEGSAEVEIQVNTTPDTITLAGPADGDGSQGVIETGINTTGNTVTLISDGTDWYAMTKYTSEAAWIDGGAWTEVTDLGAQS